MRTKTIAMIVLSMLLVLCLASVSANAMDTEATVAFTEGTPEFVDPESDPNLENMDIDFGSHNLPIGAQVYEADDSDHTLRITDPRSNGNAGGWEVGVKLGSFVSVNPANTFDGKVTLVSPQHTAGLDVSNSLSIVSGAPQMPVVTADAGLNKGNYDTKWAKANITLSLDATASATITEPASYAAELTWTLAVA